MSLTFQESNDSVGGLVEFNVSGSGEGYLDLSQSQLYVNQIFF